MIAKKKISALRLVVILFLLCISPLKAFTDPSQQLLFKGDNSYPPFEFINEAGNPDGFNIAIMDAVIETMNLEASIELGIWAEVREELTEKKIDALTGVFKTEQREQFFDFSMPHFISSFGIFTKKNSSVRSIEDLANTQIIVQKFDVAHDFILENQYGKTVLLAENYSQALQWLTQGLGDCILMPVIQGNLLLKELGLNNISMVGKPFLQREYCFAVAKGNTALLALLNEGLTTIKQSGEFDTIYAEWFGIQDKLYRETVNEQLFTRYLWLTTILLFLIAIVLLISWSLRKRVVKATNSLRKELMDKERIQQSLEQNQASLRQIIDLIPHRISVRDIDGNYVLVNKAVTNYFHLSEDGIIGKHMREINGDNPETDEVLATDQVVITSGLPLFKPAALYHDTEGHEVWMQTNKVRYEGTSQTKPAVLNISTDMTDYHRMEEQLRQSQKLDALGQLAGGIAHDFNNQLTGIQGYAELLETRLQDPVLLEYINNILEATEHSKNLTMQLLTYARKGQYQQIPVSMHQTIESVTRFLQHSIDKRITIITNFEATHYTVLGDPTHMQNMLINLALNARDAMPGGGELTFRTRNDSEQEGAPLLNTVWLTVEVSDTGTGMNAYTLSHIFEPFFTTKEPGKGTGMGLAAVYGAVQALGGSIQVSSTVSEGSTFILKFPCVEDQSFQTKAERVKPAYTPINKRILLVEDEKICRQLSEEMVKGFGCSIVSKEDGIQAIYYFSQHYKSIDLVILDMIMPNLDGESTLRILKKIKPEIPVILVSGFSYSKKIETILSQPECSFLLKPFTQEALYEQIIQATAWKKTKKH